MSGGPNPVSGSQAAHSTTTTTVARTSTPTTTTASSGAQPTSTASSSSGATTTTATTSASSTTASTTSTTTTATTTTATSSTTTSATTAAAAAAAATAAAAAASAAAAQQALHQYSDAVTKCNNCLFLVRRLRLQMEKAQNVVRSTNFQAIKTHETITMYRKFEKMQYDIKDTYEKLEMYSKRLPKHIPAIESLNGMRTLYAEEHTMDHDNVTQTLEKMIDAGNWNEGQYQIFYYLSELLRMTTHRKRYSVLSRRPLVLTPFKPNGGNPGHQHFEQAFVGMKKEIASKSLGIYPRIFKNTPTSMIAEFKFGYSTDKHEKNIVYTMKYLLIEKNGIIEYINIYAPDEDWVVDRSAGDQAILPTQPSRYLVFQKLTQQANMHLMNSFGTSNRWSANTLVQFVLLFGKMKDVFETRCRHCKKILKNFLPPMCFDIRSPNAAVHEGCK